MKSVIKIQLILTCILISEVSFGQSFTQVTLGDIVNDGGASYSTAWGDYNNDGFIDLFVGNFNKNFLYKNNGDGSFTKDKTIIIETDNSLSSSAGSWGDYDNDGDLDLFVSTAGGPAVTNLLYSNNGDGSFTKITSNDIVNLVGDYKSCSWGDYNGDGDLDLFVAVGGNNLLYANNNDGSFTRITTGDIVNDGGSSYHGSWADYNNDGHLDLFVANGGLHQNEDNFLYSNNGDGTFTTITTGDIVNDGSRSVSGSWGDYNNDGYLDLFVSNGVSEAAQNNFLYSNDGDGTFTKITTGDIVNDASYSWSSGWVDFDNDGDLDMYVTNDFGNVGKANFLYSNNGDGTFTKVTTGHIVTDENISLGSAWADYDNDGDMDLFVAIDNGLHNLLYNNDGNSNNWINFKLLGNVSNTSAIGARVQIKANINGVDITQIQELSGQSGGGFGSQNSLNVEFGLGDAEVIDEVSVKWPSGTTEIYTNISPNQFTTVREGGNNTPIGEDDLATTEEDNTIDIAILGNDTNPDADGDDLTVQINDSTTNGSLTLNPDNTITYIPDENYFGTDAFTYILSDGFLGGRITLNVSITVSEVNDNPIVAHQIKDQTTVGEFDFTFNEGTFEDVEDSELVYTATLADGSPLPVWLAFDGLSRTFSGIPDGGADTYLIWLTATDSDGLFISDEFKLDILTTEVSINRSFTQITSGDIVNDGGNSYGASWGDYDNDGHVDLFVANGGDEENFLYHNNGDGTFSKITTGDIATDAGSSSSGSWGDYDNDGDLDLVVIEEPSNRLYANNGDGTFTKITTGVINGSNGGVTGSWGDYDNDGDLDLFIAGKPSLYKNNGDGTFLDVTAGDLLGGATGSGGSNWVDYDNDDDLDIFIISGDETKPNYLFRNDGNTVFTKITTGDIVTDKDYSSSSSWGDYDNDGDLDVFIANGAPDQNRNNNLYKNNGDGSFTKITTGSIVSDGGYSYSSSWGDMDNDGDLDLYVTNNFGETGKANFLYSNNSDGTFTKITDGHIVTDENFSLGCGLADFDNDGDLDLFIAMDNGISNLLYTNDGNSNNWINLKAVGITSNKSAIGSKIQIKANITGVDITQIQELSGQTGAGVGSQNSLNAEFGLGNAEIIDEISITWPSGITEVYSDIRINQFAKIREGGNAAPLGEDDQATIDEDNTIEIAVLGNDSDPDGDNLTVQINDSTSNGSLIINPDNTITYIPNENYFGTDAFTYILSDGFLGGRIILSVSITVTAVNDKPIVAMEIPDQSAIYEFDFTFNAGTFEDVEDSELEYTATLADGSPLPIWLAFDGVSRTFSGTPDNGVNIYAIKVTATDSDGLSVSDEFNVDLLISNLVEINEWKGVSIYPNPTTEIVELFMQNNYKGKVYISLYDHRGKQLLNEVINKINFDITYRFNLATRPNGLYLIRVESGDRINQLKAIKY